ncbi:nitrous oxide reductase accessory protein NosL [Geobacter pelophilus]|uniref:Nitrous oxide reductase accessory protein NosL n=1 Tax=Geoanaerobacter pelophilus TaxID=60036 RepID=A0AAW4L768_9BACT|nr:nitrous oxide reductase accessory protein NosL [Geoanaerobacter pelophilus]MBT0665397.1 nitrous oxide reductase accessory protein NosL [Geoanaerobacter pelophilus]
MKKLWMGALLFFALCSAGIAADKVEAPDDCKHCGMNRTKFSHSRMLVAYGDGSSAGTCSINCVVTDLNGAKGKKLKSVQVADYDTKGLIDAKSATWVIGGNKKGVMTKVAKWAFAKKQAADSFVKENGGKIATYDEALKMAQTEHAQPTPPQNVKGHGEHKM